MDRMNIVRENIADYLNKNGIKQLYICEKTGMTPQALSSVLKCERKLDVEEYIAICDALNLKYDYFIKTDNNPKAS